MYLILCKFTRHSNIFSCSTNFYIFVSTATKYYKIRFSWIYATRSKQTLKLPNVIQNCCLVPSTYVRGRKFNDISSTSRRLGGNEIKVKNAHRKSQSSDMGSRLACLHAHSLHGHPWPWRSRVEPTRRGPSVAITWMANILGPLVCPSIPTAYSGPTPVYRHEISI